jgi:hypothetical protein
MACLSPQQCSWCHYAQEPHSSIEANWQHTRLGCGGKLLVCLLQFLRHWRRLQPEVWAAAVAATLDSVLAAMPRAAHDDSALQVYM